MFKFGRSILGAIAIVFTFGSFMSWMMKGFGMEAKVFAGLAIAQLIGMICITYGKRYVIKRDGYGSLSIFEEEVAPMQLHAVRDDWDPSRLMMCNGEPFDFVHNDPTKHFPLEKVSA